MEFRSDWRIGCATDRCRIIGIGIDFNVATSLSIPMPIAIPIPNMLRFGIPQYDTRLTETGYFPFEPDWESG